MYNIWYITPFCITCDRYMLLRLHNMVVNKFKSTVYLTCIKGFPVVGMSNAVLTYTQHQYTPTCN
jgi:hypothetical protein